VNKRTIGSYVK